MASEPVGKDEVLQAFKKADVNGDGVLTREELVDVFLAIGIDQETFDGVYEQVDKDGNGTVDYDEFVSWIFNEGQEWKYEDGDAVGNNLITTILDDPWGCEDEEPEDGPSGLQPWEYEVAHSSFTALMQADGSGTLHSSKMEKLLTLCELPMPMIEQIANKAMEDADDQAVEDDTVCFSREKFIEILQTNKGPWNKLLIEVKSLWADDKAARYGVKEVVTYCEELEANLDLQVGIMSAEVAKADADGDGDLTWAELKKVVGANGNAAASAARHQQVKENRPVIIVEEDDEENIEPEPDVDLDSFDFANDSLDTLVAALEGKYKVSITCFANDAGLIEDDWVLGDALGDKKLRGWLNPKRKFSLAWTLQHALPSDIWEKGVIKKLTLCNELKLKCEDMLVIAGLGGGEKEIWLNCSCGGREAAATIVHEAYHCIDNADDSVNDRNDTMWRKLNKKGFKYLRETGEAGQPGSETDPTLGTATKPGFLSSYSQEGVEEDKAVTLESIVMKKQKFQELAKKDPIILRKANVLKQELKKFLPGFNDEFWNKDRS